MVVAETMGCGLLFLSGWLAGRSWERTCRTQALLEVPLGRCPSWNELPSGWSRTVGAMTVYAMSDDGGAYWWVTRRGRTIIEGLSNNIETAKVEAEREARELAC